MLKEFKEFIARGNVLDLAIGIVIGAAFGKIVSSFVADILMPPIGMLMGKMDFSNLFINLSGAGYASLAEAKKAGANVVAYGHFIQTIFDFLIVAFFIFLVIQLMAKMQRKHEEAVVAKAAEPTATEKLLMEIRDRLPKKD